MCYLQRPNDAVLRASDNLDLRVLGVKPEGPAMGLPLSIMYIAMLCAYSQIAR
jgi:hypothetical protein